MSSDPPRTGGLIEPTILALAALAILIVDQGSKAVVAASIGIGERVTIIGQFVELWHAQNRGAASACSRAGPSSSWQSACWPSG